MKATETSIVTVVKDGLTINMSLGEKESESGISSNTRLLFLSVGHFFGYLSKIPLDSRLVDIDLTKAKVTVIHQDLRTATIQGDSILLDFYQTKGGRKEQVKWLFKFRSKQMALEWGQLFTTKPTPQKHNKNPLKGINDNGIIEEASQPNQESSLRKNPSILQPLDDIKLGRNIHDTGIEHIPLALRREGDQSSYITPFNESAVPPISDERRDLLTGTAAERQSGSTYLKMISRILADSSQLSDNSAEKIHEKMIESHLQSPRMPPLNEISLLYERQVIRIEDSTAWIVRYAECLYNPQLDLQAFTSLLNQFQQHCKQIVAQAMLSQISDDPDIQVQFVTVPVNESTKICNRDNYDRLKSSYLMYEYANRNVNLKEFIIVPLTCFVELQGHAALCKNKVKISDSYQPSEKESERLGLANIKCSLGVMDRKQYPSLKTVVPAHRQLLVVNSIENYQEDSIQRINSFAQTLNDGNVLVANLKPAVIVHPYELQLMLEENRCELRAVSERVSFSHHRRLIDAECVARSLKIILMRILQDEGDNSISIEAKVIDVLNCVLGANYQTDAMWKVIRFHTSDYFGISLNRENIDKGLLLMGIAHHCHLKLDWKQLDPQQIFETNEFFPPKSILAVFNSSRTFKPRHIVHQQIEQLISSKQPTQQNFEAVKKWFPKGWPKYYQESIHYKAKLAVAASTFIPPGSSLAFSFSIYHQVEYPTSTMLQLMIQELKWDMKNGQEERYIHHCDAYITLVCRFHGDYHPALSWLYDTFSEFHQSREQFEDAITFAKSSLVNMTRLNRGVQHNTIADSYFWLAECYYRAKDRRKEALSHFSKCKSILEHLRKDSFKIGSLEAVDLRIAVIKYEQRAFNQCLFLLEQTLPKINLANDSALWSKEDILASYEAYFGCYIALDSYRKPAVELAMRCGASSFLKHFMDSPAHLERILRQVIRPIVNELSPTSETLMGRLATQMQAGSVLQYSEAYELIKTRIIQGVNLAVLLDQQLRNLPAIKVHVDRNPQIVRDWKAKRGQWDQDSPTGFVALCCELTAFLSEDILRPIQDLLDIVM